MNYLPGVINYARPLKRTIYDYNQAQMLFQDFSVIASQFKYKVQRCKE